MRWTGRWATGRGAVIAIVLAGGLGTGALGAGALGAVPVAPAPAPTPSVSASSYTVFDARTGRVVREADQHRRYESASLVKLLIAIDLLERLPGAPSRADRRLLEDMLRVSDDGAASTLWTRGGGPAILDRTARRLGLTDTLAPPDPGTWGYTTTSSADVTKIWLYLRDRAPARVRDLVLGAVERYEPCAADGHDQSFGLPAVARAPVAVKQGWADWPTLPAAQRCRPVSPPPPSPAAVQEARKDDPTDGASPRSLHTSGLADGRGRVVVVLTEVPPTTSFRDAAEAVTALTRTVVRP